MKKEYVISPNMSKNDIIKMMVEMQKDSSEEISVVIINSESFNVSNFYEVSNRESISVLADWNEINETIIKIFNIKNKNR